MNSFAANLMCTDAETKAVVEIITDEARCWWATCFNEFPRGRTRPSIAPWPGWRSWTQFGLLRRPQPILIGSQTQEQIVQAVESPQSTQPPSATTYHEVNYRYSRDFTGILQDLRASLLVSTYQAGKLVTIGTTESGVHVKFNHFERAMGIALHPRRIAIGSRGVIWMLQSTPQLAARMEPVGQFDACFLARQSFITGNIQGHEMAWVDDELWVVNTLFSCLCSLDADYSFVPRWRPPFITQLEAGDRCHLNGLALEKGRPKFVTVMAATNETAGWRPVKSNGGQIIDIASGEAVATNLSMPHSPRVHDAKLWVLNSGCGSLETVNLRTGKRDTVALMPGYTRGLAFCGKYAFVGLSRIRETSVFEGVPIAKNRDELRCAIAVVDLSLGESVAFLEFQNGVEEIFDVQVLPQARCPSVTGPEPLHDDAKEVWVVPTDRQVPQLIVDGSPISAAKPPGQRLTDDEVSTVVSSALRLQEDGWVGEAVRKLKRTVAARPQSAKLYNLLGNAWQELACFELAIDSYEIAVKLEPNLIAALQNLGTILIAVGRFDEGMAQLQRAQQLQPAGMNRVMLAISLPVIYKSLDEVPRHRQRLETEVQRLLDEGVQIDTVKSNVPTNFYSAYHGEDVFELQRKLARLYRGVDLTEGRVQQPSERLRVGFISAHFRNHTIGRLNLGRLEQLDRQRFEVTIISLGHHADELSKRFRHAADRFIEFTGPIDKARRHIADLKLDLLFFADVGMNPLVTALSFSRMAPVQCVTWGHPVTTGSPTMDYFLSSELLEPADGQDHYTEQLFRLSNLGTYYHRPRLFNPLRRRQSFGLEPGRHLYFCAQTLFKLHPEFDAILAELLRRDPLGDLIFVEGRHAHWSHLVKRAIRPDDAGRGRSRPFLATAAESGFSAAQCAGRRPSRYDSLWRREHKLRSVYLRHAHCNATWAFHAQPHHAVRFTARWESRSASLIPPINMSSWRCDLLPIRITARRSAITSREECHPVRRRGGSPRVRAFPRLRRP